MQKKIKVNGQEIPAEAIQYELERLTRFYVQNGLSEEQLREQLPHLLDQAIQQTIGQKLLMEEAIRLEIPVTEQELDEAVAKIEAQVGGVDKFKQALEAQKTPLETFRRNMASGVRVDKLVAQITADVPTPTAEEVATYFNTHRDEYVQDAKVLAQHILIAPDGETETSKQEALTKIEAIRERIVGGSDFATEATEHSACPSGQGGGSLGWFGRGMMVPEFDEAAFTLEVGAVSDVIETQFGYHLIYKTDVQEAQKLDFDDVKEKVRERLWHSKRGSAITQRVEELKALAQIEVE